MERRQAGQGAAEKALEGVPHGVARHVPTIARTWAYATDPASRSWLKGERGERQAAAVLVRPVARLGGQLVYDVQVGGENIDLIAIVPTGIFVIEVKRWSGHVRAKGDVLFYGSRRPNRVHAQVERQRRKLAAMLELDVPIDGIIVFVPAGDFRLTGKPDPGTTPMIRLARLPQHIKGPARDPRPTVLAPHEIDGIASMVRFGGPIPIRLVDGPPEGVARPTTAAGDERLPAPGPLPEPVEAAGAGAPAVVDQYLVRRPCGRCGAPTVERNGPRGAFLGCSTFPTCRKTSAL